MNETLTSRPQVFMESEAKQVEEELKGLAGLSSRFRAASKVRFLLHTHVRRRQCLYTVSTG